MKPDQDPRVLTLDDLRKSMSNHEADGKGVIQEDSKESQMNTQENKDGGFELKK